IDPGYRGHKEGVYTQYANLHENPEEKFYIPNNVYIIGTMNDIDRSVDTFDFAMRRRFTFLEIKAEDSAQNMLTQEKTKELMTR
ncbi:endonuclease, partial [Enterococcus faecalis]|nr:endonuclease [Enterococcus faecalis]